MSPLIVPLLHLAVNAAILSYVARLAWRARQGRSWPKVAAVVTESIVVRAGKGYRPKIEYAYMIDGRTYKCRRRSVGMPVSVDKNAAEAVAAASPKGSTVLASVDPRDPAYAVLFPGMKAWHVLVIAGLTLDFISTVLMIVRVGQ